MRKRCKFQSIIQINTKIHGFSLTITATQNNKSSMNKTDRQYAKNDGQCHTERHALYSL